VGSPAFSTYRRSPETATLFGNVPPEEMTWIRSGSFLLKSKTEMLPSPALTR
jgi:hypothetical protein